MIRKLLLLHLILLPLLVSPLVAGDPEILPEGSGTVAIYGGGSRADHYYTVDGDLRRFDTIGTLFTATVFGLNANYGIAPGLELNLELPVGYFSLTSEERFPDRSIFAPLWLGLGATYQVLEAVDGKFRISTNAMVRIPPGFHNGIYDDPNHPSFLSDGYLQVLAGVNVGVIYTGAFLKASGSYNWRGEEPVDEIHFRLQAGVTRVKGTGIYLAVEGVVPTKDVTEPARPFYAGASGSPEQRRVVDGGTGRFATIDREHVIALTPGAWVDVTREISIFGSYTVRLAGANTLALGGAFLGAGYRF